MLRHSLGTALLIGLTAVAPATELIFGTSFEAADDAGYDGSSSVAGVQDFSVFAGGATSSAAAANTGTQSVSLTAGTVLDRAFSGGVGSPADADRIVWVQGYFQGAGSDTAPDLAQIGDASAVIYFGNPDIQALNGTTSTFVDTGIDISASAFTGVLLRLDFSTQTYDVYSDTGSGFIVTSATAMPFKDSKTELGGFQQLAATAGFLDDFQVRRWVRFDANNDGNVNVADSVTVVNELNSPGTVLTDPLNRTNADAGNLDGTIDSADLTAVNNALLSI